MVAGEKRAGKVGEASWRALQGTADPAAEGRRVLCHHGREQIQRIGKENWKGDSSKYIQNFETRVLQ